MYAIMKQENKTRLFVFGSIFIIVALLLFVLFVEVLFPVNPEDVSITNPSLGNNFAVNEKNISASDVIVEVADFQCPFCQQALPSLRQVKAVYGNKVTFIYKHFPLASAHPNAMRAAEASECARDQGKFWEYHDLLFKNQNKLQENDLIAYAASLALDKDAFSSCLSSGIKKLDVQNDFQEGLDAGVQGTPIFFINGRRLEGAQPYAAFKQIIDEELADETA